MTLYKQAIDLKNRVDIWKSKGMTVGFVPTMGALHPGHLSLIQNAQKHTDKVVCSIFVNPTQFNNAADFEKYPITIDNDIALLEASCCDVVFLPSVQEIYPNGTQTLRHYDLGFIEKVYDGAFRPGHFQGVCNVVETLFRIVHPDKAFFGLKDYQQCMVIRKLTELMNWQNQLELVFCETLREANGLAMSSRNMRLTPNEREHAAIVYNTLINLKKNIAQGDLATTLDAAKSTLTEAGLKPDYVDIADAHTLEPVKKWNGNQKIVCLIAAFLNEVRLIDNMTLN
jgi:pantoate--beta-alanine ligase